jgi:hypothetical protein
MTTPYFNALGTVQESEIWNDLTRESIYNHGINALYLKAEYADKDEIMGDTSRAFNDAVEIDVLIKESSNIDSDSNLFEKFGIIIDKTITLQVHRDSFLDLVGVQPKKGDLVWLPAWDLLMEITSVNSMNKLQFGSQFVYSFVTTLFQNNAEEFNTGVGEIDKENAEYFSEMAEQSDVEAITQRFNELVEFSSDNPFSNNF